MSGSLSNTLISALSGLSSSQNAINVVARNTANANTDGYTRKTAQPVTQLTNGLGQTVRLAEAQRQVDSGLVRNIRDSTALNESLSIQTSYLRRLEGVFGPPGDADALPNRLTELKSAFEQLVSKPEGVEQQLNVIRQAETVARTLDRYSTEIQDLRLDADHEIADSVTSLNTILGRIEELNVQIAAKKGAGKSSADLEDQRDIEVKKVSELIGIKTYEDSAGRLSILTENNTTLLDGLGGAATVSFTGSSTMQPSSFFDPGPPVGGNISGLSVGGTDITSSLQTGKMAGLFTLRDTTLMRAQAQLDTFSVELIQAFEGTGTTAGLAGNAVKLFVDTPDQGTGVAFPGPAVGASQRIQVNPILSTDPWRVRDGTETGSVPTQSANTGDSSNPLTILTMFETAQTYPATIDMDPTAGTFNVSTGLGTSGLLTSFASEFISFNANIADDIKSRAAYQDQYLNTLQSQFDDDSGVNIDQELSLLLQYQNSYAASARVISTVQDLFDSLLSIRT